MRSSRWLCPVNSERDPHRFFVRCRSEIATRSRDGEASPSALRDEIEPGLGVRAPRDELAEAARHHARSRCASPTGVGAGLTADCRGDRRSRAPTPRLSTTDAQELVQAHPVGSDGPARLVHQTICLVLTRIILPHQQTPTCSASDRRNVSESMPNLASEKLEIPDRCESQVLFTSSKFVGTTPTPSSREHLDQRRKKLSNRSTSDRSSSGIEEDRACCTGRPPGCCPARRRMEIRGQVLPRRPVGLESDRGSSPRRTPRHRRRRARPCAWPRAQAGQLQRCRP